MNPLYARGIATVLAVAVGFPVQASMPAPGTAAYVQWLMRQSKAANKPAPVLRGGPKPGTKGFLDWWTAHYKGQKSPSGYHYEAGSDTITPNDACWREEMFSPGTLSIINSSVGKPNGVPAAVSEISDLASPDPIQLSAIGIRFSAGANSISCHATLRLSSGDKIGGVISLTDPGAYAPIQFKWLSDVAIAAKLAQYDRLATSKTLLVKPDLKTPEIQECVGRRTALGAGEQFPGQLWAACAAEEPAG